MQQRLHSSKGEPTRSRGPAYLSKVRSAHGDHSLNARVQPHHTDATESLFHGDANQRKAEAVKRMGRISDLNCVGWECGQSERGILLEWVWLH
jgi:hypothetical protein